MNRHGEVSYRSVPRLCSAGERSSSAAIWRPQRWQARRAWKGKDSGTPWKEIKEIAAFRKLSTERLEREVASTGLLPKAFVRVLIRIDLLPEAVLPVAQPRAGVHRSVQGLEGPDALHHAVDPLAMVQGPRRPLVAPHARLLAAAPLARVLAAVGPAVRALAVRQAVVPTAHIRVAVLELDGLRIACGGAAARKLHAAAATRSHATSRGPAVAGAEGAAAAAEPATGKPPDGQARVRLAPQAAPAREEANVPRALCRAARLSSRQLIWS